MEFKATSIQGVIEIFPRVFGDERGYFFESYQRALFVANGITEEFVQDNQSFSKKGVVRGLHLQRAPFAQGKLVRVIQGRVLDVAVDVRPHSPTFGQFVAVELSTEKQNMLYIPPGFAHGFATLEDAIFSYKCTQLYDKASEGGILWNDPTLGINWQIDSPIVSDKDQVLPTFKEFKKLWL
ncbi:MAG: dTDP-4-dehydrorhamnose 3,5-epimerase [Spirosomataceae bacterium]